MAGQPNKYKTALYLRLSKDDGTDNESQSIQNQKDMLTRYCKENGFTISGIYIDDGVSGVSFNREGFNKMIADIEAGKINCVITKDLSRLGRNYIEAGTYVEIFFPERCVRYIAVNDNVDTERGSSLDITPFKNLLNEMYAKDISNKVHSALHTRQQQGKYTGAQAPYGYIKDPADKNHLLIDEECAPAVRRMYALSKSGVGIRKISKILKEEKIPRPSYVASIRGERYKDMDESTAYDWTAHAVRDILQNPVYRGAIVVQRTKKLSMKSKKVKRTKEGESTVEGCHEAIIKPEEWHLVQSLITSRKHVLKDEAMRYDNIFSGLVKCPDCGYSLTPCRCKRKLTENVREMYGYQCNTYRMNRDGTCTRHSINADVLYNVVLEDIQRFAKMAVKSDEKMVAELAKRLCKTEKDTAKQNERDLKKHKKRLSELDKLYAALHENYVNKKVSEHNFMSLSKAYETEQAELEEKIRELSKVIEADNASGKNAEMFVELIKPYAKIRKLTQAILNKLIDRIEVHEPEMIDGESIQKVDVFYKYVGSIG